MRRERCVEVCRALSVSNQGSGLGKRRDRDEPEHRARDCAHSAGQCGVVGGAPAGHVAGVEIGERQDAVPCPDGRRMTHEALEFGNNSWRRPCSRRRPRSWAKWERASGACARSARATESCASRSASSKRPASAVNTHRHTSDACRYSGCWRSAASSSSSPCRRHASSSSPTPRGRRAASGVRARTSRAPRARPPGRASPRRGGGAAWRVIGMQQRLVLPDQRCRECVRFAESPRHVDRLAGQHAGARRRLDEHEVFGLARQEAARAACCRPLGSSGEDVVEQLDLGEIDGYRGRRSVRPLPSAACAKPVCRAELTRQLERLHEG